MSENGNDLPEAPERRGLGGRFGVISRVRLGRAALALGGVELAAGAASLIIGSPDPSIITTVGAAWVGGEVLYNLYNHRNQPREQIPGSLSHWVAKEDPVQSQE